MFSILHFYIGRKPEHSQLGQVLFCTEELCSLLQTVSDRLQCVGNMPLFLNADYLQTFSNLCESDCSLSELHWDCLETSCLFVCHCNYLQLVDESKRNSVQTLTFPTCKQVALHYLYTSTVRCVTVCSLLSGYKLWHFTRAIILS